MENNNLLKVALAQISPVWLDKNKTIDKVKTYISQAGNDNCDLVIFGEALLPGYPYWLSLTDGAAFDSSIQKDIHAHYIRNAVQIAAGDLEGICALAKQHSIAVYIGLIERAHDRGGHSLYCSLVYINKNGEIQSVHRKMQPTYEERLTWAAGDGNGLQTHSLNEFTVGGLNCWENWMPMARMALYGMGENLHVAVWPGSDYNTREITRFIARESRSFVVSVSGLMQISDFPADTPHLQTILNNSPQVLSNGGSCIAGPDGEWIIEPVLDTEGLITATLDVNRVYQERQNFDVAGHYSRPDILQLTVNTERQGVLKFIKQ